MSSERSEEFSESPASRARESSDAGRDNEAAGDHAPADQRPSGDNKPQAIEARPQANEAKPQGATLLVRGEAIGDQDSKSPPRDSPSKESKDKEKAARKEVSPAKAQLRARLPALGDDGDIGVQKDQIVVRDGKPDLVFTGTLVASAAPHAAPKGKWQEYRIYETNGGKHVFSKVTRSVYAEDQDAHAAEIYDPSPSSVPSQLLKSARDLTRSRPLTWMDAAVAFFGYDPLAKDLYRKLGGQFEEHIA